MLPARERIQRELDQLTVDRSLLYREVEEAKRRLRDVGAAIAEKYDELRRLAERARR